MNASAMVRALERGRRRAERELAAMRNAYQRLIVRAAGDAARALQQQAALTASDWQPPPEGLVAPAVGVTVTLRRMQHQAVENTVRAALERGGVAWDATDPALQQLLADTEAWSGQAIDGAFQPELRKLITRAFQDGLSVRDAAKLIRASFAETAPWQAEMLARSSLNMLGNAGMHYAVTRFNGRARAAGEKTVDTKTWLTAGDAAVRPTHVAAEHQTVPVESAFQVGGSSLMFPGDPGGALSEILNCRCTTLYGVEHPGLVVASAGVNTKQMRRKAKAKRALTAAAIPPRSTPVVDEPWDGNAAMGRCSSASDYRSICAWVDSSGDAAQRQSYKFPHHANPGGPANINGVRNALARLPQASIPSGDVAGVRRHLQRHMDDWQRKQGGETAAVTITVDEQQAAPPEARWVSDIAFEGEATEDGRFILTDALTWREPPLTLMAMTETGPGGHEGAFVAGRMDSFEKTTTDIDGEPLAKGVTSVRSAGVFDVAGDNGAEVARFVSDETVRGISVDLAILDWVFRDPHTGDLIEQDEVELEQVMFGDLQMAVRAGQILAATVCPTPAFANAKIALTASGERVLRLTTTFELVSDALVAAAAPVRPKREWFFTSEPSQATPLTVTDDGHVFGHIAAWGTCHIGRPGECFQPPSSPSGYAYFNLGEIECADGATVAVGQITMSGEHAALNPSTDWKAAKAHYENTAVAVADVRAVDGVHGIFVAGALRPHVTDAQIRELRAAKPSGDWRQITPGGPLEMIGAHAVNRPGYPVPRPQMALAASAAHPEGEIVALIAGGFDDGEFDRRMQVLEAKAGGLDALVALAEA